MKICFDIELFETNAIFVLLSHLTVNFPVMIRTVALLALLHVAVCKEYLLPGDIAPHHYDVSMVYDIDPHTNFSFYGVVDILITVIKPTSKIVLHAEDFSVQNNKITLKSKDDSYDVVDVKLNNTYNFLTVSLGTTLNKDQTYTLTIPFYGNLNSIMYGVYISSYVDKKSNAKEYLVVTHFQAIGARKAFPCFDEPLYKASFQISLAHHRQFTALSNMPLASSSSENTLENYWSWEVMQQRFMKDKSEFVWDKFENSVLMSTYLVAFVISKFAHVDSPATLSKTKFKIWARSDAIYQAQYASIIGPKLLSHFENWFEVPFPLPKLDMVAVPDFPHIAMENWGLVIHREYSLLCDEKQSSYLFKEFIAEIVAHELAHQWYGNLVTMKWWSDIWLNEGFATFTASLGVAVVEPEWKAEASYALNHILKTFKLDVLETSHPVSQSALVDDPKRIMQAFGVLSYSKAFTLIRMMSMFLGKEVFRKALKNYIVKYSYNNAEQDDLWRELTEVSQQYGGLTRNVTIKEVMDTWTTQTGYPLLTVTRDYTDNSLTITQKRYLNPGAKSSTATSWWVPLRVLCESEVGKQEEPVQWLAANEGVSHEHRFEHGASSGEWVLFNTDMIAPYRVNYDSRNWRLLADSLRSARFSAVPVLSRVQLVSDAMALAWTNALDYDNALQLVSYLSRETEYLPLNTGTESLEKIENVLKRTPDYGAFQKFMRHLIAETYERVGGLASKSIVNGHDFNGVKMQVLTSSWACRMAVAGCEENAIELFQRWMDTENPDDDNPIPLDLQRTVYCVAMSRGGVVHWRFLLARKQRANIAAASSILLESLACTKEVWILSQMLEWTITDGSEVRRMDSGLTIVNIIRSTVGYYIAKDFIYNRIEDIYYTLSGSITVWGIVIQNLLEQFTTQNELDQFLSWREKNARYFLDVDIRVQQGIESAQVNINWLQRNRKHVVAKMREHSTKEDTQRLKLKNLPNSGELGGAYLNIIILCTCISELF